MADAPSSEPPLLTGRHGGYHWLSSSEQYVGTLVGLCPEVVLGRWLAVTSMDSGAPLLTEPQQAHGWQLRSGIAYSPRIAAPEDLCYQRDGADSPGYDEWYLFDAPPGELGEIIQGNPFVEEPKPGRLMVFVNYFAFVLHDTGAAARQLAEMFWRQLEWIQPAAYVADGRDNLTFVCRDGGLFDAVHRRLSEALQR